MATNEPENEPAPSGPWTVYRRKPDAGMWSAFSVLAAEQGLKPFALLTELAHGHVAGKDAAE